jgi:hypothetical protein
VSQGRLNVLERPDGKDRIAEPKPSIAGLLGEVRAVFLVGVALLATLAWIAFLGWLMYRAILTLGVLQ